MSETVNERSATETRCRRCRRCGRALRSAGSIARGTGRACARREWTAAQISPALGDFTEVQVEKALSLLDEGALLATNREGVFRAVSSDGATVYLLTADWCACPARKPCYHMAAALAVQAAALRRAA